MIPLETEFYSKGFCHKLVRRAGFVAWYARWRRFNPHQVHFEVILISPRKSRTVGQIHWPAREVYPTSEQWGWKGWTYRDENEARAKFEELLATEAQRELPAVATSIKE
jgi:hypothetical protein